MASTRISDIKGPQGPEGPEGPAGPNTVPTEQAVADALTTPGSAAEVAVSAKIETAVAAGSGPRLFHLDSYNDFFGGGKWIAGQTNVATTLTAAVASGASVLPVTSASGLSAGVQLLVAEGTANQRVYTVQSVASNNVTIVGTTTAAIANGAAITPLWTNSSHLTVPGYTAFARFIAQAKDNKGEFIIKGTAPKVTYLGNSWISQGLTAWATQLNARLPAATVVNAGIAGNKSSELLARFDTDVPADSNYVVFNEPGVNDDTSTISPAAQAASLQTLVQKIRALGATPIYTGHVPLADVPTYSAARQIQTDAAIGDGTAFPGTGVASTAVGTPYQPDADSLALGTSALLKATTGNQHTAYGAKAGAAVTTGVAHALFGREAGTALTSGNSDSAFGHNALRSATTASFTAAFGQGSLTALTTASEVVGVGALAGAGVTSGGESTFVGKGAGYTPGGVLANATTTAIRQTVIGKEAGLGSATQANDITAVGYRALVTGGSGSAFGSSASAGATCALAVGYLTSAGHAGGVAIGTDNTAAGAATAAVNEIALGTALHNVKVLGTVMMPHRTAPASPTDGMMWTTSAGLFVRVNGATVGPLS